MRRAWPYVLVVVGIVVGLIYWFGSPVRSEGVFAVDVLGYHVSQTETGRGRAYAQVRFEDDRLADVPLPPGTLPRRDAQMRVEVFRRAWPPSGPIVAFRGFVESSDQTDTPPAP